jgi:hypothetical protein
VESVSAIDAFLARVGRRLRWSHSASALLYTLAALVGGGLIIVVAAARFPGVARQLGGIAVVGAGLCVAGCLYGLMMARRRWSAAQRVARFVGERSGEVASDLLSSVELIASQHPEFSGELLGALHRSTADKVDALDPAMLAPVKAIRRPAAAAAAAAAFAVLMVAFGSDTLAAGFEALAGGTRAPFEGAAVRTGPVVGDVEIELAFPAYTGRPPVTLPAAAGDFRALEGTVATIRTRSLGRVASARLVFGEGGEATEPIEMEVSPEPDGLATLRARLTVTGPLTYRFLVESPGGAKQVEAAGHRIEIEPDAEPEVELHTPGDQIDVADRKRIELAYITTDDFGIDKIELVWEIPTGSGTAEKRLGLPHVEPGRRSAQSKYLWDLAEVDIPGGSRVPYWLEVTDNKAIGEPNVGKSKRFYLRVYSPRERHENLVARQREIFEAMIKTLGGRLVVAAEDLAAHRNLLRSTRAFVVEIGTVVNALGDDKLAAPELSETLAAMRDRHDRFANRERKVIDRLATKRRGGGSSASIERELAGHDREQVTALEDDVIALADWIDRQDLEGILLIADEIKTHRERLDKLLAEYQRTGDPAIKAEIDRELKAIRRLMAEAGARRGKMREDVLDRFVNLDAAAKQRAQTDCLKKVDDLLAAGDADGAAEQMKKCSSELDQSAQQLEQQLAALRGDKFEEEQKAINDLLSELAELAASEDELAGAIDRIYEDYASRASEAMREELADQRDKLERPLEALRKRLDKVPAPGLTPFAADEVDAVKKRLDDLGRMLADGDLAEAMSMSRQAEAGIESAVAELQADLEDGEPWNAKTDEALEELEKASKLAVRLTDALKRATPSPDKVLDRGDRRKLERLHRRQAKLRQRATQVAKRAAADKKLPRDVGTGAAKRLEAADGKMGNAQARLRAADPAGARHAAHEAADALRDTVRQTVRQARGGLEGQQNRMRDEPVRIPGADEYRAPKELREDILEAMKKKSPDSYKEMIKRYYEELIK